ncbi:helix-turn-helix domain-containing protein [Solibacillus sp. FSL W7-1464]|uniref:helix-turn-helix domain-containing protein n=1 Tax=Solibacillus sp. FSL W7-1464 TaxID=2921706 RepID=UPI0030FBF334
MEYEAFSKDYLAENLKNLRIYCGFKTFEVADFLNLTSSAYGYYEIGRSIPPLAKLIKLALLYGVTVEDLVRNPNELMAHIERERKLADIKRELNLTEEQLFLFRCILDN